MRQSVILSLQLIVCLLRVIRIVVLNLLLMSNHGLYWMIRLSVYHIENNRRRWIRYFLIMFLKQGWALVISMLNRRTFRYL